MRGIGLDLTQPRPPRVIELMDQRGIAGERLGCGDILDPVALPQPVRGAEGFQPAFGAYPRAGQDDNVA